MSLPTASPTETAGPIDPAYLALIHRFPLRPLRSTADYDAAVVMLNGLIDCPRSPGQEDYLEVLGDLIAVYDVEHHPPTAATPGGILRLFLEDRGVSPAELAQATGISVAHISAMLQDQRRIGRNARAALAQFFEVEPADFVVE